MSGQLPWRKAIERVLQASTVAVHYLDITEKIIELGLRTELGATPAATVSAYLTTALKNEGADCPWLKVGRGLYVWRANSSEADNSGNDLAPVDAEPKPDEAQYSVISSFGMFWRREEVDWGSMRPKLLGMQQIGAEPVDFCNQLGIYLLYDGREVIYAGRATERPLGRRLYEHTLDRLSSRWDRFSWFGLTPVSESGELGSMPESYEARTIIPAMEAVLIEALEPRQNRKRGDDLGAVEYLQKRDPEIEKKIVRQKLESALNRL